VLTLFVTVVVIGVLLIRLQRLETQVERLSRRLDALGAGVPPGERHDVAPATRPGMAPASAPAQVTAGDVPRVSAAIPVITTGEPEEEETIEGRIGGRLLLYAGMIVLVLGVTFFLRYAFENEWLSPTVRVLCGAAAGLAMVGGGLRVARNFRAYGLFLAGGGIALLFLSVYAALNRYFLLEPAAAFTLFLLITTATAVLADRTNALGLAAMSVCGGFATPFLVGGPHDAQVLLFSYVALLVAVTWYLARRRAWPWLDVVSLLLTILTCAAWFERFYTRSRYLTTELFLTLYCAMFVAMLRDTSRSAHRDARAVSRLLLIAPVVYHGASLAILAAHAVPLLVYLIAMTAVVVIAAVHIGSATLRLVAWFAVALPLAGWIEAHQSRAWLAAAVTTSLAVFAVHLAAQVRTWSAGRELPRPDVVLLHANGIGVFVALHQALVPVATVAQLALVATAAAAFHAALSWTTRATTPAAALHFLAVALTLTAIAVSIQFDGPWAVAMWATEGAVVFWIASRTATEWLRAGAWLLVALAALRWLQQDIQETSTGHVVVANARALSGLYMVGMLYAIAWIQRRADDAAAVRRAQERAVALVAASALTVFVITTEITSFWAVRREAANAYVARELMLSAAWAAYAGVLVGIGIRRRYAPIRYFAIALFGLTLAKVFIVDLETLGGIYRIAGFIVVGVILLLVSFLYQRARPGQRERGA